tara:strand:- start:804 stop:1079 length:276 start_codon:yes stop_codon:yes gene_type:complete
MSNNTQSKFETGRTYSVTSIGDQNCRWTYTVVRRTAKSVWLIDDDGKVSMFRIRVWEGEERVSPLGNYSMSPTLRAGYLWESVGKLKIVGE